MAGMAGTATGAVINFTRCCVFCSWFGCKFGGRESENTHTGVSLRVSEQATHLLVRTVCGWLGVVVVVVVDRRFLSPIPPTTVAITSRVAAVAKTR